MNQKETLAVLAKVPKDQKPATLCALVGHSLLRTFCFGYNYCARCGQQLGDSLGGAFQVSKEVIQHHDGSRDGCNCAENFKAIGWRDTMFVDGWRDWTKPRVEDVEEST
jgi:hypothetical protein